MCVLYCELQSMQVKAVVVVGAVFACRCMLSSVYHCSCIPLHCVRVKPEALVLLLVRSQTRGTGNSRYDVHSPLHLTLCASIPQCLWDEYCRLGVA